MKCTSFPAESEVHFGSVVLKLFYLSLDKKIFGGELVMTVKIYSYPKCSTCRKAKKWLEDNGVTFEEIHIVENPPTKAEVKSLYEKSNFELKKFFNNCGQRYRELGMKDKIKVASEDELLELLGSDGMLLKRPIVTDGKTVTLGFKEELFEENWR